MLHHMTQDVVMIYYDTTIEMLPAAKCEKGIYQQKISS